MSSVLVSGLTDVFKSQMLGPFAASSGESESSTLRGFETGIGAMVTALSSKIGQSGFVRQLTDLINSPANDSRVLDNPRTLVGSQRNDNLGGRFLSMLFGNRLPAVSNAIGNASGLRAGSASGLLTAGAPLLLGMLGKQVREGGMDSSRLSGFLSHEAEGVRGALPAGVERVIEGSSTVPPVASSVVRDRRSFNWPLLIIGLAILAALFSWLATRRTHHVIVAPPATTAAPVTGFTTRALPGNANLHIPVGGMEDRLLRFIQDPSQPVNNTSWFDFDRLLFDTNSATLQPGSQEQLHNIAAILAAYPNVHVKIGGYTDNTGDAAANMRLSQDRANAVKQKLVGMGIAADRMEAQGYDSQHPVASNGTEQGRQQNRRISLLVTQK